MHLFFCESSLLNKPTAPQNGAHHTAALIHMSPGCDFAGVQGCKRRVRVFIDIEGFEYELLQYLLDTHAEATCAIRVAAIEWHGRMMPKGSAPTGQLKYRLRRMCNTTLIDWA